MFSPVDNDLECEMCSFSTKIEQEMYVHLAKEYDYCYICNKTWSFHNSSGIFYHLSEVHSQKLLKCKSCSYVAFSKIDIIEHQKSHTGFNLDSTVHSDENPTIDNDNCNLNVSQPDFLNDQQNADISIENVLNKSPSKPEKNDKSPGKVEKIQAFGCYICSTVCTVKYCLKKHFKKHHIGTEYEHSKALKLMLKCSECESTFEMYHQIEIHFAENNVNELLNPEKIQLGNTMKSAKDLFVQKKKSLKQKDPKCDVETEKCTEAAGYLFNIN